MIVHVRFYDVWKAYTEHPSTMLVMSTSFEVLDMYDSQITYQYSTFYDCNAPQVERLYGSHSFVHKQEICQTHPKDAELHEHRSASVRSTRHPG